MSIKILKLPILLASQSPRRKEMLEEAGFTFRVQAVDLDEIFPDTMPVEDVAEYLAIEKAKAAFPIRKESEIILAADSVVILNNKIYGKPVDRADAIDTIRTLSDTSHKVITGVCLSDGEKLVSFSGVSEVDFHPLTDEEIIFYVDTCKPYDKAGSYGIQEWIGHCKIKRIVGSYTNIKGLPVNLVYHHLAQFIDA